MNYNFLPSGLPAFVTPPRVSSGLPRAASQTLRRFSRILGLSLLFHWGFSFFLSFFLEKWSRDIPLIRLYLSGTSSAASNAMDIPLVVLELVVPFLLALVFIKHSRAMRDTVVLPLGPPVSKPSILRGCGAGIGLAILCGGGINTVVWLFASFFSSFLGTTLQDNLPGLLPPADLPETLLFLLRMTVFPAFTEELIFRGTVLQPLRRYGDLFAITCSAVLFGLVHGTLQQAPGAIFSGFVLGYFAVATGTVWTSVLIHFFVNLFSVGSGVLLPLLLNAAGKPGLMSVLSLLMNIFYFLLIILCLPLFLKRSQRIKLFSAVSRFPKTVRNKVRRQLFFDFFLNETMLTALAVTLAFIFLRL